MAQGTLKKLSKPTKAKANQKPKKGVTKPQKPKLKSTADKVAKKLTSGLVSRTEEMLGERAGHLELIGKGRKKGEEQKYKGGSRKFG